jgi:hypothetical protein
MGKKLDTRRYPTTCPRCKRERPLGHKAHFKAVANQTLCPDCTWQSIMEARLEHLPLRADKDGNVRYKCPGKDCGIPMSVTWEVYVGNRGELFPCKSCRQGKCGRLYLEAKARPRRAKGGIVKSARSGRPAPVSIVGCSPIRTTTVGRRGLDFATCDVCSTFERCLDHAAAMGWPGWRPSAGHDRTPDELEGLARQRREAAMHGDGYATAIDPLGERI